MYVDLKRSRKKPFLIAFVPRLLATKLVNMRICVLCIVKNRNKFALNEIIHCSNDSFTCTNKCAGGVGNEDIHSVV